MPRRYGKKYSSYRRSGRYGRRHAAAASSIARAWRVRKRRRTSLVSRTALSNRRQIRKMNKAVETKVLRGEQATPAQQFAGQWSDRVTVDNTGQEVGAAIPFAGDLLYCAQGAGQDERIGAWIQLHSLTMHYCISTTALNVPTPDCWYEIFVVHDKEPLQGASLVGAAGVLQLDTANPAPQNALMLAFQNLGETGKEGRFKILARKKHRLSSYTTSGQQIPPITTSAASGGVPPVTFGDVSRSAYLDANARQLPRAYPAYVNGSINLKLGYKINYGPDVSTQPSNQTLRVMAFQCNPTGLATPTTVLQYYTRVRFKDA